MEPEIQTSTPPTTTDAQSGSWGAIISIVLILLVVVVGAYYAFTSRISPTTAPAPSATATST